MGGVLGALLAQSRFRSTRAVLDGDHGFWVMAGSDQCDVESMTADLGKDFRLLSTSFKPYAACRWTHAALDCVRALQRDGLRRAEDIDRVEVHTFHELAANFTSPHPEDVVDAQFSLPHLIALELTDRSPARGLREVDLRDHTVNRLAARVDVHHEPAADKEFEAGRMPSRVVCRLRSGDTVEKAVTDPIWGSPGRPFTDADLLAKCQALIEPSWGAAKTEYLIDGILNLDRVVDVTTILPSR